MNISWYGHRCVRIEAKGASILVDPFDPKDTGLRGPAIKDDVVLLSEHAPAPSVTERINDDALVIRNPGEYEKKGVTVRGIQAAQDSQQGRELGLSSVFVLHAEEMTICHLGALGQEKLTDEQLEAVGDCDVLLVPAGGQGALDAKAAAALAMQIEPKIVVPIGAEKPDKFIKEMGLPVQKMESLRIQKKALPVDQTILAVLAS
jgi:L-ascorbate metabolism protein UlaG (beta-lactamase superfamily)